MRAVGVVGVEGELQDDHAGQPERVAQPLDGRRDDPEVLGDERQPGRRDAQRPRGRGERRTSRPADPAPAAGVGRARGRRPIGHEAAEVVDAREVEKVERACQTPHPPAVASPAQRRPVVDRVAPQLALVGVGVGRRPGLHAVAEQLRVRAMVGAAGRHVDRHVADDAHAALRRVAAQRAPLALEAHLVGHRASARERLPVPDPVGVALAEGLGLGGGHAGATVREEPAPRRERRRRLVRRPVAVGGTQREHLPPRLARRLEPVDPLVGRRAEAPPGQGGDVQLDAA